MSPSTSQTQQISNQSTLSSSQQNKQIKPMLSASVMKRLQEEGDSNQQTNLSSSQQNNPLKPKLSSSILKRLQEEGD